MSLRHDGATVRFSVVGAIGSGTDIPRKSLHERLRLFREWTFCGQLAGLGGRGSANRRQHKLYTGVRRRQVAFAGLNPAPTCHGPLKGWQSDQ